MRAHQISPQAATSVTEPLRLIAVPIICRCIAPVCEDHYTSTLAVRVNGLLIEDAMIGVLGYIQDGRYAKMKFTGTTAIFAAGIGPAIAAARLSQIEFVNGWIAGPAREQRIEIMGEVMTLMPHGGKVFSLVGGDR